MSLDRLHPTAAATEVLALAGLIAHDQATAAAREDFRGALQHLRTSDDAHQQAAS